jgi:hypothetical protein
VFEDFTHLLGTLSPNLQPLELDLCTTLTALRRLMDLEQQVKPGEDGWAEVMQQQQRFRNNYAAMKLLAKQGLMSDVLRVLRKWLQAEPAAAAAQQGTP